MSRRIRGGSRAENVYRFLLRAYPHSYRARFGESMLHTFLLDFEGGRSRGIGSLLFFWIVAALEAVTYGLRERASQMFRSTDRGAPANAEKDRRALASLVTDASYALRKLVRSPLFAGTSIVSLSIGLAAATTLFALADALLLKSTPGIRDAESVVQIERTTFGEDYGTLSYPIFEHLRDHTRALEQIAATTRDPIALSLRDGGSSERVHGTLVSGNFFDLLRVRPALGRLLHLEDDVTPEASPLLVLSYRYWQRRFDADPKVLDKEIRINGQPFSVIGVVEEGFDGTTFASSDLWLPMTMVGTARGLDGAELLAEPWAPWHRAVGRLAPGASRLGAQAELNSLLEALKVEVSAIPESVGIRVDTSGQLTPPARPPFTAFIGILLLLAVALLAIACSNVAGMLLARAAARQREMATRLALGAPPGRLLGQLLMETLLLFAIAAVVSVPIVYSLIQLMERSLPALPFPIQLDLSLTGRTFLFLGGIALLAGLGFGLAPAQHVMRSSVGGALHTRAGTGRPQRQRLRQGLVVVQVAFSLATVITAGLFVRSLHSAAKVGPGFRTANVEVVSLNTKLAGAEGQDSVALMQRVVESVEAIGGVQLAGHGSVIPLQGGGQRFGSIHVPGADELTAEKLNNAYWDTVSPDYFHTIGLPIVQGRAFTGSDRERSTGVAIVNEAFARAAWPTRSPVGQHFRQYKKGSDDPGRLLEVVGVARDAKYRTHGESAVRLVYVPHAQQPSNTVELFVQHSEGVSLGPALRRAIAAVEPNLPVVMMQSFDDATSLGLLPQRLAAWTAGVAGGVGVFLAALGLYGLAAFLVAHRTREIGIRMALGASQGSVRSLVLSEAARLGLLGTIIGVGMALVLGRALADQQLLVGVKSTDPITFVALVLQMGLVLFVASYLPARRAASTDPALTLRE